MEPRFYTKSGLLTRYAFSCGYVEEKAGLFLDRRHGTYHVVGWLESPDSQPIRVWGSFDTVTEARRFMRNPLNHKPSRSGSVTISEKN